MVMIPDAPRLGDMPSGEPVPEGVYHIRCDKATFKTSKEKHNPMVEATFTIFGPADAEEFHGRKVFDNLMLSGEGMFRTRQLLEASGETDDFVLEDTDQLLSRECAAVVQTEKAREEVVDGVKKSYQARSKIARYSPIE
jgi:hypothetical protein